MRNADHSEVHSQSRREFLKHTTLAAAWPAVGPSFLAAAKGRKPNLLVLWADEQRADTMAAYGNQKIHAPNLNRLADESVVFEKTYVSQPVCTPSRSTVMTGLWPHQSGCTQNNVALAPEVPAFPEIVKDPDYRTGYFGKWHLGDEIFAQHGFEEWRSMEDGYWRYYRENRDIDEKSDYFRFLQELDYKPDTSRGDYSRGFAARLPIEHCKPSFLEQETCAFLKRHRNEPFMLYVNFLEPHMPFFGPLDKEHDPAGINLPANLNDPFEENEPEEYRRKRALYRLKGYKEYDLKKEQDWRQLIAKYWGLVTQVDRSVGVILETLEMLGLAEDTIVVHTSDHGDMMGSHGLLTKSVMFEEAARVPWLMRVPQLGRSQQVVKQPVSHIDLVPTLLDLMDAEGRGVLPGQSLKPLLEGRTVEEDHVFLQWNQAGTLASGRNPAGAKRKEDARPGNEWRAVVSPEGWKLCLHTKDRNQLYNLAKDPGETTNVYDVPANRGIIQRLTARIHAWQKRVKDCLKVECV